MNIIIIIIITKLIDKLRFKFIIMHKEIVKDKIQGEEIFIFWKNFLDPFECIIN